MSEWGPIERNVLSSFLRKLHEHAGNIAWQANVGEQDVVGHLVARFIDDPDLMIRWLNDDVDMIGERVMVTFSSLTVTCQDGRVRDGHALNQMYQARSEQRPQNPRPPQLVSQEQCDGT